MRKMPTEKPPVRLNAIWKNSGNTNAVTSLFVTADGNIRMPDGRKNRYRLRFMAEWCHRETVTTDASVTRLKRPDDLAVFLGKPGKNIPDPWLSWAIELQFIAQAGQTYSRDPFDLERFGRIGENRGRNHDGQIRSGNGNRQKPVLQRIGIPDPELDTRAAIFENGKILLVRETAGKWSLPGGWVDVDQSIASNTVKEVKEEAGLDVEPVRLIRRTGRKQETAQTLRLWHLQAVRIVPGERRAVLPPIMVRDRKARFFPWTTFLRFSPKKTRKNRSVCASWRPPTKNGK